MRILDGMEMTCFCKSKHFEIEYAGKGKYTDQKGEVIPDVIENMVCYACTASYYTRESDPIPFCPNCGTFEKKRFNDQKEISEFLRGQDFKWLTRKGLKAFIVKRPAAGWELKFANQAGDLQRSGAYDKVIDVAG